MSCKPFRRAKGAYLFTIHHEKYLDLRENSNILGHSYKKLTTVVKNSISSSWNIKDNSIYHLRFNKLITSLFNNNYYTFFSYSLQEFFLRLFAFLKTNRFNIAIETQNFKDWLNYNLIEYEHNDNSNKVALIFEMASLYINTHGKVEEIIKKIENKKGVKILNYFWWPELEVKSLDSDLIILPQLFCGNFQFIAFLIKKDSVLIEVGNCFKEIPPSLYLVSALKNYYLIKQAFNKYKLIKLKWTDFLQINRIFTYTKSEGYFEVVRYFKTEKKVLLNEKPPYYNYLPIILEEHHKKFLSRLGC